MPVRASREDIEVGRCLVFEDDEVEARQREEEPFGEFLIPAVAQKDGAPMRRHFVYICAHHVVVVMF